jgi:phosphatidylserine/phosphatidylglycerophosphate/cardiolipin synthase-like enzyme
LADGKGDAQPQQKQTRPIGAAKTGLNVTNTIEPQCDKRDPNVARWFDTGTDHQGVAMPPVRKGNDAYFLIDGQATFQAMFDAMKTATDPGHFIYLLAWYLDLDVRMSTSDEDVADRTAIHVPDGDDIVQQVGEDNYNPRQLFTNVASAGPVEVRVMLWDQPGRTNSAEVKWINKLNTGAAILDNRTLDLGAHHQKMLVVYGSHGLIGFCGGIDINTNRISQESDSIGSPLHDAHCRIMGPAAWDLLHLFVQRWTDHPDVKSLPAGDQGLIGSSIPDPGTSGTAGDKYVQIGRTFGNGSRHEGIGLSGGPRAQANIGYRFAPNGEMTAWQIILHGIKTAREFIYVEDQYLISMDASNALRDQLSVVKKIIILIPPSSQLESGLGGLPGVWGRRKDFIDNIISNGNADRLIVCSLFPPGVARPTPVRSVPNDAEHTYVHAKTWVFDDEFAVIGSANCNNRGYNHDSEVVAGITDESADAPCTLHFAHRYRMQLWAEHLNMRPADLFDPVAASVHWAAPAITSRIAVYDQDAGSDGHAYGHVPEVDPIGY